MADEFDFESINEGGDTATVEAPVGEEFDFGSIEDEEVKEDHGFLGGIALGMRDLREDLTTSISIMLPIARSMGKATPMDILLEAQSQSDFDRIVSSAAGDLFSGLAAFRGLDTVFSPISASAAAMKATVLGQNPREAFANRIVQAIGLEGVLDSEFGGNTNIPLTPTEVKIKRQAAGLDNEAITDIEALGLLAIDYAEAFVPTPIKGGSLSKLKPGLVRLGVEGFEQIKKLKAPAVKKIVDPLKQATSKVLEKFLKNDSPGKVGIFKRASSSVGTQLKKMGAHGKELFHRMNVVGLESELAAGKLITDMEINLGKLTDSEAANLVKVLDDVDTVPISKKIAEIAAIERQRLNAVIKQAQEHLGKTQKIFSRDNYFPHIFTKEALEEMGKASFKNKSIEKMMKSGRYKSIAEAETALEKIKFDLVGRKFGNLEYTRVDELGDWIKNPKEALSQYYMRATRRIAEAKHLGQKDDIARSLIGKIEESGFDSSFATRNLEKFVGNNNVDIGASSFLQKVRNFETVTKLGLAQITNAPQGLINTALNTNVRTSLKAFVKSFTKEGKEFASRSGATLSSTLDEIARLGVGGGGKESIASKFLQHTGFAWTESKNRVIASLGGKMRAEWAMDVINGVTMKQLKAGKTAVKETATFRKAKRVLDELGINANEAIGRGSLTADELLEAGLRFSNVTQFRSGVLDLPEFFSSEWGKTLFQFKSFAFNHTKFLKKVVTDDFKSVVDGDLSVLPKLLSTLGLGVIVGEVPRDLRMILKGQNPSEREVTLNRVIENLGSIGGLGIASDLWSSLQFGKSGVYGFVFGPAASDAVRTIDALSPFVRDNLTPSKTAKALLTEPVRQIPGFGNALSKELKKFLK